MALPSLLRAQMPSGADHGTALQEVRSPVIQSCWSCVCRATGHSAGSQRERLPIPSLAIRTVGLLSPALCLCSSGPDYLRSVSTVFLTLLHFRLEGLASHLLSIGSSLSAPLGMHLLSATQCSAYLSILRSGPWEGTQGEVV